MGLTQARVSYAVKMDATVLEYDASLIGLSTLPRLIGAVVISPALKCWAIFDPPDQTAAT